MVRQINAEIYTPHSSIPESPCLTHVPYLLKYKELDGCLSLEKNTWAIYNILLLDNGENFYYYFAV